MSDLGPDGAYAAAVDDGLSLHPSIASSVWKTPGSGAQRLFRYTSRHKWARAGEVA
jgi:hypothetical protein